MYLNCVYTGCLIVFHFEHIEIFVKRCHESSDGSKFPVTASETLSEQTAGFIWTCRQSSTDLDSWCRYNFCPEGGARVNKN